VAQYYEAYAERPDAEGRERYLKSGNARRFLQQQLRHYLEKFPGRVGPKAFYAGQPRLDSNQE